MLFRSQVFSLLSFCFKYLVKSIRDHIEDVYAVYSELVHSKNQWVRKFAAQSFSYVLRKVAFTKELMEMLGCEEDHALGVAELLYEVVQGGQAMHSKTSEVISCVMTHSSLLISEYLLLKIVNNIDTKLLLPVFETVVESEKVPLVLVIMSNSIRLKFGKRLTPPVVELMFKYLL